MYTSVTDITPLKQRHPWSTWLTFWAVLVSLLCVCQSQNERLLRTVAYPYPLSFNIAQVNGSAMTDVAAATDANSYRTLTLHDGKLFVGGKSQLFSVRTENLSLIDNVTGFPDDTNNAVNYITVIQPLGDNLLECGTGVRSPSPYCRQRSSQNLSVAGPVFNLPAGSFASALAPDQNTSWLLVQDTAGSGYDLYVGTRLKIDEPALGKLHVDPQVNALDNMLETVNDRTYFLNDPQFVGDPIDYNGRIYFFFREYATEHINGGKIVYSRVARICKNDTGGASFTDLDNKFTTFEKARLSCSIEGAYDFYYNDIQDVYQSTTDTNVVYAIFTTERNGVDGSALCAYRLDELEALFFTSQYQAPRERQPENIWAPVPTSDEVLPRNQFCPSDRVLTDTAVGAIMAYTLLNDVVENKLHYESMGTSASNPLLISNKERFSRIVVDNSTDANSTDVFYIGTENGTVLKAYLNGDRSEALVVEEISLNTDGVKPVLSMLKSDSAQAVFVGTDSRVYKIPFEHCCDYILRNLSDVGDPYCQMIVTGDRQQDLSRCSGEPIFDRITIHRAPSDRTRAINIPNQPVNLYLAAEAPVGSNLRVVGDKVDCGDCEDVPYTNFKSVGSNGAEFQLVTINGSTSHETRNCSCAISVEIENGSVDTTNFTLTADTSAKANVTAEALDEVTRFDKNVVLYKFQRDEWLKKVGESCMLENVGLSTQGDSTGTCP